MTVQAECQKIVLKIKLTDTRFNNKEDYLIVKFVNEVQNISDVRNLDKKKQDPTGLSIPITNLSKEYEDLIIYISLTELAEKLNILKAIADLKFDILLEQLFKFVQGYGKAESWSKIVPIWPMVIRKGHIVNNRLSEFIEFILQVKVEIKKVITIQDFYVIELANFEILLEKKSLFIVLVVPKSWIKESEKEEDKCDEDSKEEDEINRFIAVHRFQIMKRENQTLEDWNNLYDEQSESSNLWLCENKDKGAQISASTLLQLHRYLTKVVVVP
ncbi:hypothetical protein C2G38_2181907 [Gigaspora rosea]|uniref:Uncharacterized protein n=1 Tax=Gigaspora rosea TaxID=44941 RepID=A0A397VHT9_9GLOM|nr:hypothetical protein C2G38_2181907 [Gigaspora rosea]